jgi:hypothetical protein
MRRASLGRRPLRCLKSMACYDGRSQGPAVTVCQRQEEKKTKMQIGINHTQEGIGHGRQPAGQNEGNNRRGGGGGKANNTGPRERNLSRRVLRDAQTTNDALWSCRMQPLRVDSMMGKGSES